MTYNSSLLLEVNFKWQIYHIPRVFFSFFFNIDEHFNVYFLVYNYIYLYMYICVRAKVSVFNHCNTLYVYMITCLLSSLYMQVPSLLIWRGHLWASYAWGQIHSVFLNKYCLMDSANIIPSGPPNCTCKKCVLSYNVWLMKILIHAGIKAFKLPIISWSNKSTDWIRYENTCKLEFVAIYTLPRDFASTTFRLTFR